MYRGELKSLRAFRKGIASLPAGKYQLTVEPYKGQAFPRPEGGFIWVDLDGKLLTAIPLVLTQELMEEMW